MRRFILALAFAALASPAAAQYPAGPSLQSSLALIAPTPASPTENNNRVATTAWVNSFVNAGLPLASGKIWIGSVGNVATAQTPSGDLTVSVGGAFTLATVNANVGAFGSATQCATITTNAKGLITAASATTCTPAVGSITGLGTGIATWLATPSSANLRSALTDETGTGAAVFATSPNITTPTGIVKGDVGLGNVANLLQLVSVKKQTFTAGGTYTPSAGMAYAIIECVGGGGGGGGVTGTASAAFSGGGGGGGGYSRVVVTAATVGASQTVTIGTAGTGGASGSNNGGVGGDTSVGTLCVGKGASGGLFGSAAQVGMGGAGGVAGTGDLPAIGNAGGSGIYVNSVTGSLLLATNGGGNSVFGAGAAPPTPVAATATVGISATSNTGGGGSGAISLAAANQAGGNGGTGRVFITEFCTQ